MSTVQISLPLIDENTDRESSKCGKCKKCVICALDILVCPLTSCINSSCWKTRRYFQYDLAVQFLGIFQTLIGILWASTFVVMVETVEHKDGIDSQYYIPTTYCILTYTLCNIIVIIMQRTEFFGRKISFMVGILGQIVAFGIQMLGTLILNNYFSSPYGMSWLFLLICISVAIICIFGLSMVRKNVCFVVRESAEITKRVIEEVNNVSLKLGESLSNFMKQKPAETNANNTDIYESDIMDLFLNNNTNSEVIIADSRKFKKEEEFSTLIKNIDTGVFTISVGYIFADIIINGINRIFSIKSDSDISDREKLKLMFATIVSCAVIICIFGTFVKFMSFWQMKRDRVAYKMFEQISNRRNNLKEIELNTDDILTKIVSSTENCLMGCCIKSSYKFYRLTEHIISFITGFLGWSFGFAMVSGIYITNTLKYRLYYSLIITVIGILFLCIRSRRQKKTLENWKYKTVQKIESICSKTASSKPKIIDMFIGNEEEKDNTSNGIISIYKGDKSQQEQWSMSKKEMEIDIFNAKAMYHQKLYLISHLNFFFQKAYGLIVALPWKLTIEMLLDNAFKDNTMKLVVSFILAVFASIILGYAGIKFIEIEQGSRAHSTSRATNAFLRGNYMQLKRLSLM